MGHVNMREDFNNVSWALRQRLSAWLPMHSKLEGRYNFHMSLDHVL